jgi:methylmalonyl-CoA epimerase
VQAKGIHHLGVAVENLEEAVETYRSVFGAELEHRETVPSQGVEAAAVRVGESRVELLRALGEDTPVGKFIANRGPGVHHVAYEVSDLRGQLKLLAEQGVELIDDEPHEGLFGLEVAFVHPHALYGVLAELVAVA